MHAGTRRFYRILPAALVFISYFIIINAFLNLFLSSGPWCIKKNSRAGTYFERIRVAWGHAEERTRYIWFTGP